MPYETLKMFSKISNKVIILKYMINHIKLYPMKSNI